MYQLHGAFLDGLWKADDLADSIWTLSRIGSFASHCSIQFGDTSWVGNRGINLDRIRAEPHVQYRQKICNRLPLRGSRMNLKQKMIPVTAVCNNRLLKSHCHEFHHNRTCDFSRGFFFRHRGINAAGSHRICVNENPLITTNVVVTGCFPRVFNQPLMLTSGITGGLHHVQCLIERSIGIFCEFCCDGRTACLEITAYDWFWINAANLNDVIRAMQQGQPFHREVHLMTSWCSAGFTNSLQVSF